MDSCDRVVADALNCDRMGLAKGKKSTCNLSPARPKTPPAS